MYLKTFKTVFYLLLPTMPVQVQFIELT